MSEKERSNEQRGNSDGENQEKLPAVSAGKRILLVTFGCQMNESDSELVRSILKDSGYRFVCSPDKADVILLNTCSVRETATRKVTGHIFEMRHHFGRVPLIGILGCMAAEAQQKLLRDKKLGIDFVAGPDSYQKLPILIARAQKKLKPFDVELTDRENYEGIYPMRAPGVNAWVTIMRGCDNFCSYCIVPYVRGRERSRNPKEILKEIKKLASDGYPQVTLLGQNVNSYRSGRYNFPKLLDQISQIKGIKRIRFMSPHPKDFSEELIKLIAARPNICKHIHLPLQSGSSRILKLMNRKYTKAQYLALVKKIRTKCPGIAITTDIIVGFPSETKKDFCETLGVVKEVRFDSAFIFKYSPRNGTLAERRLADDVAPEEKTRRIVSLNETQIKISLDENKKMIGQTETILIDERKVPDVFRGRTDTNKLVSFENKNCQIGQLMNVRITHASVNGLSGKIVKQLPCARRVRVL